MLGCLVFIQTTHERKEKTNCCNSSCQCQIWTTSSQKWRLKKRIVKGTQSASLGQFQESCLPCLWIQGGCLFFCHLKHLGSRSWKIDRDRCFKSGRSINFIKSEASCCEDAQQQSCNGKREVSAWSFKDLTSLMLCASGKQWWKSRAHNITTSCELEMPFSVPKCHTASDIITKNVRSISLPSLKIAIVEKVPECLQVSLPALRP